MANSRDQVYEFTIKRPETKVENAKKKVLDPRVKKKLWAKTWCNPLIFASSPLIISMSSHQPSPGSSIDPEAPWRKPPEQLGQVYGWDLFKVMFFYLSF